MPETDNKNRKREKKCKEEAKTFKVWRKKRKTL